MKASALLLTWLCVCVGCDSGSREQKPLAWSNDAPKPEAPKAEMRPEDIAYGRAIERNSKVKALKLDEALAPRPKNAPKPAAGTTQPGDPAQPPADNNSQPGNAPSVGLPTVPGDPDANKSPVPADAKPLGADEKDLGGGYIGAVFSAYFSVKDKILVQQLDQSLALYKLDHNDKPPQTEQEFMDEVVKKNGLKLPELEPGKKYHYDPATGKLYVASPK